MWGKGLSFKINFFL
ncbi:hypothetical protein RDI58_004107 [Solanum bulbocastanum]|uniref:Uncharacterized protein n=1 Tax=Solanum bulbocastanum TaxID=147425 RepID=A0AAN8YLE0_SOLBU